MNNTKLSIVPVEETEVKAAAEILQEVAQWLINKGEKLWIADEIKPDKIKPIVLSGNLYFLKKGDIHLGTIAFQWEDKLFWPEMPQGEAAYIHRLAVRRSVGGQHLGKFMIDWAKKKAEQAGREFLRLDCPKDRTKLCQYYQSIGFVKHSTRKVDPYFVARFQMKLNPKKIILNEVP